MKPGAENPLGRMSFVKAVAAAGAWSGSIVSVTSAACIASPFASAIRLSVRRRHVAPPLIGYGRTVLRGRSEHPLHAAIDFEVQRQDRHLQLGSRYSWTTE